MDRRQLLKISAYSSLLTALGACAQINTANALDKSKGLPAWPSKVQKIIFGSCIDQNKAQPIWQSILAAKPDLFIFGGDNVYASNQPWQLQNLKNLSSLSKKRWLDIITELILPLVTSSRIPKMVSDTDLGQQKPFGQKKMP